MTLEEVMIELEGYGSAQTRKVLGRHGARDPFFGVKIGDMKKTLKKVKKNHELALELYETGNSDAMYLAIIMDDAKKTTREQLDHWLDKAYWYLLSGGVAALAAETPHGQEAARDWIESDREFVASGGWACWNQMLSSVPNDRFDYEELNALLTRARNTIHDAPNRVRNNMNGYVIALGSYVPEFTEAAMEAGRHIGKVEVDMGDTSCKVSDSVAYIQKIIDMDRIGRKRKAARC